jgi:putative transposase
MAASPPRCYMEQRLLLAPTTCNQRWPMDFVSDSLEHGRHLRCLTVEDHFGKESIDIVLDHGVSGLYATHVWARAVRFRGLTWHTA